jgi:hypothetical protein
MGCDLLSILKASSIGAFNILPNFFLYSFLYIFIILKANHNKDYSVVKTFKAAQVAFFMPHHQTLKYKA